MTVVDIHCHAFNADDLPIRGFIHRLYLRQPILGALLSELVDSLIQGAAPGYAKDKARLDLLLGQQVEDAGLESVIAAPEAISGDQFERDTDAALAELLGRNPVLVQRLGREVAVEEQQAGEELSIDAIPDVLGNARRAVRWVRLFGESRVDLVAHLVRTFDDEVDLFCPMLVDLGTGLGDAPRTTVRQQVELQEKISRLAMLGKLPGGGKARLHPLVGFDPRAQLRAEVRDIDTPLDVVQDAVMRYGFVGVKLYPPMGWRPIGNQAGIDMSAAEAARLDEILRVFYRWCEDEQVPVTAHCNDSNFAHKDFRDFTSPDNWVRVLEEFPGLHLNLGHFGGRASTSPMTAGRGGSPSVGCRNLFMRLVVGGTRGAGRQGGRGGVHGLDPRSWRLDQLVDRAVPARAPGGVGGRCSAGRRPGEPAPGGCGRRSVASPGTRPGPSGSSVRRRRWRWAPAPA